MNYLIIEICRFTNADTGRTTASLFAPESDNIISPAQIFSKKNKLCNYFYKIWFQQHSIEAAALHPNNLSM
jgi:hypothetical protein